MSPTAPSDVEFYTKFGVPRSGVPANRENNRKGLRFSSPMFKAIENDFVRRLEHDHILGKHIRDHLEQCRKTVNETVTALPIPNHVSTSDPTFFTKALNKLLTLINETRVKQGQRQVKRESTESHEARRSKAQKISMTETAAPPLVPH